MEAALHHLSRTLYQIETGLVTSQGLEHYISQARAHALARQGKAPPQQLDPSVSSAAAVPAKRVAKQPEKWGRKVVRETGGEHGLPEMEYSSRSSPIQWLGRHRANDGADVEVDAAVQQINLLVPANCARAARRGGGCSEEEEDDASTEFDLSDSDILDSSFVGIDVAGMDEGSGGREGLKTHASSRATLSQGAGQRLSPSSCDRYMYAVSTPREAPGAPPAIHHRPHTASTQDDTHTISARTHSARVASQTRNQDTGGGRYSHAPARCSHTRPLQQERTLADGWKTRLSRKWQKRFYYNILTGQTQWSQPARKHTSPHQISQRLASAGAPAVGGAEGTSATGSSSTQDDKTGEIKTDDQQGPDQWSFSTWCATPSVISSVMSSVSSVVSLGHVHETACKETPDPATLPPQAYPSSATSNPHVKATAKMQQEDAKGHGQGHLEVTSCLSPSIPISVAFLGCVKKTHSSITANRVMCAHSRAQGGLRCVSKW